MFYNKKEKEKKSFSMKKRVTESLLTTLLSLTPSHTVTTSHSLHFHFHFHCNTVINTHTASNNWLKRERERERERITVIVIVSVARVRAIDRERETSLYLDLLHLEAVLLASTPFLSLHNERCIEQSYCQRCW